LETDRVISDQQRHAVAEQGLVKVTGLLDTDRLAAARDAVYARLEQQGLWRDDAWCAEGDDVPARQKAGLKGLSQSRLFTQLVTEPVVDAARSLIATGKVEQMTPRTQLLFTPPGGFMPPDGQWRVPHNIWHFDYARLSGAASPGVQLFTFVDRVGPRSGGTLVVAGSHRFLNDRGVIGSKEGKRVLKKMPFFGDLMDKRYVDRERFVDESEEVDGVSLRVVELTGEPGDAYFMDLRCMHSLGPNASARPRLMVTGRFMRADVAETIQERYSELTAKRQARKDAKAVDD
jgi:ectoine hydroxylase-related dioxygenase (phytanoyl-CoA dioxygenase family)